ncbi:MAG: hypothetical protein AB7U62_04415 [Pseudolabrys sp.]
MAKRGRKPIANVHRRPGGRISRARGARPTDGLVESQPHRLPFDKLMGAAHDARAATALGRLRLIGLAEETYNSIGKVARILGLPAKRGVSNGLTERQFAALSKYAEVVARERWVRAAPKDKPQAIAFMQARGIDLNVKELSDEQAERYIRAFEANRAVLTSVRLGEQINATFARQVKRAVDHIVLDDRDPDPDRLALASVGADALALLHFGVDRPDTRKMAGFITEKPTWQHPEREIEILYSDGNGGTRGPNREKPEKGWKKRHRSLAGG